jgi:hypothetical protein
MLERHQCPQNALVTSDRFITLRRVVLYLLQPPVGYDEDDAWLTMNLCEQLHSLNSKGMCTPQRYVISTHNLVPLILKCTIQSRSDNGDIYDSSSIGGIWIGRMVDGLGIFLSGLAKYSNRD